MGLGLNRLLFAPLAPHIAVSLPLTGNASKILIEAPPPFKFKILLRAIK